MNDYDQYHIYDRVYSHYLFISMLASGLVIDPYFIGHVVHIINEYVRKFVAKSENFCRCSSIM